MQFFKDNKIEQYFDVRVFCTVDNVQLFCLAFNNNISLLRRNGLYVTLIVHHSEDYRELKNRLENTAFINLDIICKEDLYRNSYTLLTEEPCSYILFMTGETEFMTDVIYQLRYVCDRYNTDAVYTKVRSTNIDEVITGASFFDPAQNDGLVVLLGKGSLELLLSKYADIADICRKIDFFKGLALMHIPEALAIQRTIHPQEEHHCTFDFSCTLENYLSRFPVYQTASEKKLKEKHNVVALVQIKNESHYLRGLFENLKAHCDGIILLDDGSSDDTYESADCEQILIKVKKCPTTYFDDLCNRNELLKLANFITADWFIFIDADERIDQRFKSPLQLASENQNADSIMFKMINLWDHDDKYRTDLPESATGIICRYRMFRNIGYMQITAERELHFPAIPYVREPAIEQVLLVHHGLKEKKDRLRRLHSYSLQDMNGKKQGFSYDYLADETCQLSDLNSVRI